jgi:hypothetical protein
MVMAAKLLRTWTLFLVDGAVDVVDTSFTCLVLVFSSLLILGMQRPWNHRSGLLAAEWPKVLVNGAMIALSLHLGFIGTCGRRQCLRCVVLRYKT